jgi:hypothetical protein
MNALQTMYWLRMALGITSGAVCAALSKVLQSSFGIDGISVILYSITFTLLIYLLSVHLLKAKFLSKVESPSKITMTGIGIYFLSWITFYILSYTIILVATGTVPPPVDPSVTPTPDLSTTPIPT